MTTTAAALRARLLRLSGKTYSAAYDAQFDYMEVAETAIEQLEALERAPAVAWRWKVAGSLRGPVLYPDEITRIKPLDDGLAVDVRALIERPGQ